MLPINQVTNKYMLPNRVGTSLVRKAENSHARILFMPHVHPECIEWLYRTLYFSHLSPFCHTLKKEKLPTQASN